MWWQTVWIYEIYAEQTIADSGEMISKYNNAVKNYTSIFPVYPSQNVYIEGFAL